MLLKAGATVDVVNSAGATPLMNCGITNQPEVAKLLLKYGADRTLQNNQGQTAMDLASRSSPAVVALLETDNKEL